MPNFADIGKRKVEEITRPPLTPEGHYLMQITKVHTVRNIGEDDRYEQITFPCKIISASDDVDEEELEQHGSVENKPMRVEFLLDTEGGDSAGDEVSYRIRRFLEDHLQLDCEGMSLSEAMGEAVNGQFLGLVAHRPDKRDPEVFYDFVQRTAPVD